MKNRTSMIALPDATVKATVADQLAAMDPLDKDNLSQILDAITILSPASAQFLDMPPVVLQQSALSTPGAQTAATAATAQGQTQGQTQAQTVISPPNTATTGPNTAWQTTLPWVGHGAAAQKADVSHPLSALLWPLIYSNGYARAFDGTAQDSNHDTTLDPEFLNRFSATQTPRQKWDTGWTVYQVTGDGGVHVKKGEDYRYVAAGQFVLQGGSGQPSVGSIVDTLIELYADHLQPGFIHWNSWQPISDYDAASYLRFYFNSAAETVHLLVEAIIGVLDGNAVPFRMKTLSHPAGYDRIDSTVLYVPRQHYRLTDTLLRKVMKPEYVASDDVSLFTCSLMPGVSIADDPGDGRSFGQARSILVADGIMDAWTASQDAGTTPTTQDKLAAIAARFVRAGLDIAAPYIGVGLKPLDIVDAQDDADEDVDEDAQENAQDDTQMHVFTRPRPVFTADFSTLEGRKTGYIDAASHIGRRLCRDAVWSGSGSGDQVGWTGWAMGQVGNQFAPQQRAMGPMVYDGTAGIAMFLADLASRNHDSQAAKTAMAAMNAVIQTAPSLKDRGLYTGTTGMGLAMIHVGQRLGQEALIEQGIETVALATQMTAAVNADASDSAPSFDYLSGTAGIISGLIDVATQFDRQDLADHALRLAQELVASGKRDERGLSWHSEIPCSHNLLGLGHGASGAALALLEAATVANDRDLHQAGMAALAYERSWFNPGQQSWPDFRVDTTKGETPETQSPGYGPTWCNGSIGITASRLRMIEMDINDAQITADINAGLAHAAAYLAQPIQPQVADLCLCHGTAGAAETILLASEVLKRDDIANTAHQAGQWIIGRHIMPGGPLPCGVQQSGEAPGLMMGLAGVGQFMLRLADPQGTRTPLILRPNLRMEKATADADDDADDNKANDKSGGKTSGKSSKKAASKASSKTSQDKASPAEEKKKAAKK